MLKSLIIEETIKAVLDFEIKLSSFVMIKGWRHYIQVILIHMYHIMHIKLEKVHASSTWRTKCVQFEGGVELIWDYHLRGNGDIIQNR